MPVPYVPVRVTLGAFVAHRYTYAPSSYRTSLYRRTFIPLSVSLWNYLADDLLMVWDSRVLTAILILFYRLKVLARFLSSAIFSFSAFLMKVGIVGLRIRTDIV